MEALAAVSGIRSVVLPRGKLSVHEEFPGMPPGDGFVLARVASGGAQHEPLWATRVSGAPAGQSLAQSSLGSNL